MMINLNKVDKIWRDFAEQNELQLEVIDKNYVHGIKTQYFITINSDKANIVLQGLLNKNSQGYNLYKTKIIIAEQTADNHSFKEVVDKRLLGLLKNSYKNPKQKEFLLLLRKYGAKRLRIENKEKILEFKYIFNSENDFKKIKNIIDDIIKTSA
ncbi:MAG: hypothetical protein MI866_19375 [Bacteroidales bacterium]|nr:hypothetical protein [Bacteroidales bacterium]